jgi:hypothetical protein
VSIREKGSISSEAKELTGSDKVRSFYCLNMFRGTNMPIIRRTISEYLPLLGGHTWKRYAK